MVAGGGVAAKVDGGHDVALILGEVYGGERLAVDVDLEASDGSFGAFAGGEQEGA